MEIKKCSRCLLSPATTYKTKYKDSYRERYSYCIECKREIRNQWNRDNHDKVLEQRKKTYLKNNGFKEARAKQRIELRTEVLNNYSHGSMACNCCGENHIEFLAIDHINNNGAEAKRNGEPKGGVGFYTYLKKNNYPEGFQVLCHNCNMAKEFYGSCPHNK